MDEDFNMRLIDFGSFKYDFNEVPKLNSEHRLNSNLDYDITMNSR